MSRYFIVPLVAIGALLAGCSEDSPEKTEDPTTKATRSLTSILAGDSPTKEQQRASTCLADFIVAEAGPDTLVKAGVLDDEFEAPESGTPSLGGELSEVYVDALLDCRDVKAEFDTRRHLYPDLTEKDAQKYVDCASDVDQGLLRKALLASISGAQDEASDKARQEYVDVLATCEKILGKPTAG